MNFYHFFFYVNILREDILIFNDKIIYKKNFDYNINITNNQKKKIILNTTNNIIINYYIVK